MPRGISGREPSAARAGSRPRIIGRRSRRPRAYSSELIGLFIDDGSLAPAILGVVLIAGLFVSLMPGVPIARKLGVSRDELFAKIDRPALMEPILKISSRSKREMNAEVAISRGKAPFNFLLLNGPAGDRILLSNGPLHVSYGWKTPSDESVRSVPALWFFFLSP
jgi:hypothetical protein